MQKKTGRTSLIETLQQSTDSFETPAQMPTKEGFPKSERTEPVRVRRTEVLFNRSESLEQSRVRHELQELINEVQRQLKALKTQDKALAEDISKLVLEGVPEKPGLYHVRFFEFVLKLLQAISKRINEGHMWLNATFEKKKKRRFWFMAKKSGTSFSRSNELTQANIPG